MNTKIYKEVEGPLRTYLRGVSALTALVAQKIFFGPPDVGTSFPFITFNRIGGGPQANLTPLDDAVVSFSVWGSTKEEAADVSAVLVGTLENIVAGTVLEAGVVCGGASVTLWLWRPDTSTDKPTPRYLVDSRITVKAV